MPFFHFSQNNTGGNFVFNEQLTHHMVIEAYGPEDANARLEMLGGYFDGCENGNDCPCCGDRWSRAYGRGDREPMVYGLPCVPEFRNAWTGWRKDGREVFVYYMDGRKVEPKFVKTPRAVLDDLYKTLTESQ